MTNFRNLLITWFQQNKRNLPWRTNQIPYFVWISEIILQQTRVERGIACYIRFIERFPDINSLAQASEQDVLVLWQGLGYYSRARNLHFASRQIMNEYNGVFPGSYEQIRKLKGIGDYTASAIASISFGLPHPVIDGNVYRVLSRIFGISTPIDSTQGKKEFARLAGTLLDREDPGNFNEAIMEFGALQCKPQNPLCSSCPFEHRCEALLNNQIDQLPVKSKQPVQRNRYLSYLFIRYGEEFYLQKREQEDIWKNMYQFPLIESNIDCSEKEVVLSKEFKSVFKNINPVILSVSPPIIHKLSHQKLHIQFLNIRVEKPISNNKYFSITPEKMSLFPFPNPINNHLKKEIKKRV